VGIQLPEVERDVRWPEYARMATAAEAAGFDSIWVGDHLLYRGDGRPERGPWEAWTLLAALAGVTERVEVGPLVACAAFHPPGVLAKMAATVDEVSAGRLVLGLGAGWNRAEFDAFGMPYDARVARFEDAFAILVPLLSGRRVTHAGRFWRTDDAVLLPRPRRRPRLMLGSNGERMLATGLPRVDAWNTWFDDTGNTAAGFEARSQRVSEVAVESGRTAADIERSACVLVELDPSANERASSADVEPLRPPMRHVASALRDLADAGADEAILVVDPIEERSIGALGEAMSLLDA
jgi:alkanesulfonate monooxygenase SsuD/methylene tetrahydromethanopterin reductase-like flavin-dependent oxidoreductase (luciferase family)